MSSYILKGQIFIYLPESTEEESRTGESPIIQSYAVAEETGAISSLWLSPALHN